MKQKKTKNEVADSLSSWVMERANRMTTEYDVPQDEACRKAHLAKRIVELMGRGVMAERNPENETRTQENPLDTVTYWDMDKCGWRTFLIRKLER